MKTYLNQKLENLKMYDPQNLIFVVNYNDIHNKKIRILDIIPIYQFNFKYDKNNNPVNWAIKLDGTCWDGEYILN